VRTSRAHWITSATEAAELRALLDRLGLSGPYILVGHFLGGLNALVFAAAVLVAPAILEMVASRRETGEPAVAAHGHLC